MQTSRKRRKKIFFFSTFTSSFIKQDIEILKEFADVKSIFKSGLRATLSIFWNIIFHDIIFFWFGSVYSAEGVFFAKLFRKKSLIVLGGVDVGRIPEINYGIWLSPWKSRFVSYAFQNADKLLVVDPSIGEKAKKLANYDGSNICCVPTGYDTDIWKFEIEKKKSLY